MRLSEPAVLLLPWQRGRCQYLESGMGCSSVSPEMVQAFRVLLYCMAYIFGGAAVIAVAVYIALVGSEILFSQPHHRPVGTKSTQSAHKSGQIVEATVDLHVIKPAILADTEQPW